MKRSTSFARLKSRRVAVAALLLAIGGVPACASQGGSKAAAEERKAGDADKFCGRRSDADCDPRNRGEACESK